MRRFPLLCVFLLLVLVVPSEVARGQDALGPRALGPRAAAERGLALVQPYDAGLIDGTQVLDIAQGPDGLVYFATPHGVLVFDGVRWSRMRAPRGPRPYSLAVDPAGRVWSSGVNALGYFAPDSLGEMRYTSLLPQLSEVFPAYAAESSQEGARALGRITPVVPYDGAVFFIADARLFRWAEAEAVQTWEVGKGASLSEMGGALYLFDAPRGVLRLDGDDLRVVPGSEAVRGEAGVVLPGSAGPVVVVTETALWQQDADTFAPLATAAAAYLRQNRIRPNGARRLPDGRVALPTVRGGLVLLDAAGEAFQVIDADAGLPGPSANVAYPDRQGGLWIGTPQGVVRVASSVTSRFDAAQGLEGIVLAQERHAGTLYVGTSTGLFRLVPARQAGRPARFERVDGVVRPCLDLFSHAEGLLAACVDGVYALSGDAARRVAEVDEANELAAVARDAETVWVGARGDGLVALRRADGRWAASPPIAEVGGGTVSVHVEADGTVWLGTESGEAVRVREAATAPRVERWGEADGLARTRWVMVWDLEGAPAFGTMTGLYRYRPGASPAFTLDEPLGVQLAEAARDFPNLFRIAQAAEGAVWFYGDNDLAVARRTAGGPPHYWIDREPLQALVSEGPYYALDAEPDGTVWVGGVSGLYRHAPDAASLSPASSLTSSPTEPTSYPALVRRVTATATDSLLAASHHRSALVAPLAPGLDALRFEVAASSFVGPLRFRYRLAPLETDWSPWTETAAKEFTNIPPGRYTFEVQAEDARTALSEVGQFAFAIQAPWYATVGARMLFGLLAGLALGALVAGGAAWRTRHLTAEARALETAVAARTAEVEQQKRQLEAQAGTLAAQAERLRTVDRLKTEFFTNVSHELRTPLTLTIGPLEDLQGTLATAPTPDDLDAADLDRSRRHVDRALTHSRQLLTLTNQLLDIARLEAGAVRLDAQVADLGAFVYRVARAFAPLAERRATRFEIRVPERPLPVAFDAEKLEQVVGNLLSNAFKFTPEGGAVRVEAEAVGETARVRVEDTGPGLAADDLPRLFDRFYRAENGSGAAGSGTIGTGVGLSIARDLTRLHGGTLDAENGDAENGDAENGDAENGDAENGDAENGHGTGARFTLRLPLVFAPTATEAPAAPDTKGREHGREPTLGETHRADLEELEGPDEQPTILVADDHVEVRAYIAEHLAARYRVIEAADGREALHLARTHLPDLIVSDVMMPHLDGVQLVEALRADPATDFLPVILLTARADAAHEQAGLQAGADDYVAKPFNARTLLARIEALLASRRRLKARPSRSTTGTNGAPERGGTTEAPPPTFAAQARAAVEARLGDEDLSIGALAETLTVSRSTLHRRLTDQTGDTPVSFVRRVRLEHAAVLLAEGAGTVSEVAYAVGFRSVSHFSQAFRRAYGTPPSSYAGGTLVGDTEAEAAVSPGD